MAKGKRPAEPRGPTERALRDAVVPYARLPRDHGVPTALLSQPAGHLLISCETFKKLTWGGTGHRDTLRLNAPWLTGELATAAACADFADEVPFADAAAHRGEWLWVPVAVPTVAPRDGCVYVTSESGDRIPETGEM